MQARSSEPPIAAHERVYRTLRARIMHGEMVPGSALTLRGIGQEFGTSMTPAREAARRLVAEGALTMSVTGRISTPELANDRIEELASLRGLLETELAVRALPRAHLALIERLTAINSTVAETIRRGDAVAYIRTNLEFHRTLYLRAQAPAMLALVETVWLQLGPTMRKLYGRMRQGKPPDSHRQILAALRNREEAALRVAVRTDVTKGLRLLMT